VNLTGIGDSLGPWLQLLSLVGAVVQCLGTVALWVLVKKFVTREDCKVCRDTLEARLKTQEDSAGELKHKVAYTPTKDDVAAVDKGYGALRADIEALAATVQAQGDATRGLTRQVNLLIEHHLGRRP